MSTQNMYNTTELRSSITDALFLVRNRMYCKLLALQFRVDITLSKRPILMQLQVVLRQIALVKYFISFFSTYCRMWPCKWTIWKC